MILAVRDKLSRRAKISLMIHKFTARSIAVWKMHTVIPKNTQVFEKDGGQSHLSLLLTGLDDYLSSSDEVDRQQRPMHHRSSRARSKGDKLC